MEQLTPAGEQLTPAGDQLTPAKEKSIIPGSAHTGKSTMIVSLFLATALTAGCAPAVQPGAASGGVVTAPPADACMNVDNDEYCDEDGVDIDRSGGTYIYNGMTYYRKSSASSASKPASTTLPPSRNGGVSSGTAPGSAPAAKPDPTPSTSARTGTFTSSGGSSSSAGTSSSVSSSSSSRSTGSSSGISSGTSSHGGIGSSSSGSSS